MIRISKIVQRFDHHMNVLHTTEWYQILDESEVNRNANLFIHYYASVTHYTKGQLARRLLNRHKVKKMEAMLDG